MMKKLINAVDAILPESLDGFAAAHADIVSLGEERKFVRRRRLTPGKVGLISGGGSGHEPLHAGFVGYGMLDAACPGQVFTAPTPDQMMAAAEAVDTGAGCLFMVKNYEGDLMNFDMGREMSGRTIEVVVTNDDVAVENSLYTTGRRGVAGTLIVEKILGAAAERGSGLCGSQGARRGRQRVYALDGRRPHVVHGAGRRQADLHDRRERDGDGGRHPRRARPPPRSPGIRQGHSGRDGRSHPRRSCGEAGTIRPAVRQRFRGHSGDGALCRVRERPGGRSRPRAARWSAASSGIT